VHTDITSLYSETLDDATSGPRRPAGGVELNRADGVDETATAVGGGGTHWSAAASSARHSQPAPAAAVGAGGYPRGSWGGGVETANTPIIVNDKLRWS
jgi:hypothetical protein